MQTFVVAPDAVLALIERNEPIDRPSCRLMAPAVLRSHLLEALYDDVREGRLSLAEATERVNRLPRLGIRLLGDRVLQRTSLEMAHALALPRWGNVEYLALAKLHGDALITRDADLTTQSPVPVRWLDELE
ncbi:hypothetical protein V3N95_00890 [Micrococcaceae bacterium Sec6.3]